MKKHSLLMALMVATIFVTASLAHAVAYRLEDFENPGLKSGVGMVNINGQSFLKVGLSPDFQMGPFGLGVDLNLYAPLSGGQVPDSLQSLSVRMVSYQDPSWGLKWGRLTDVTFGSGLLMNHYDSGNFGNSEFTTQKAGFMGYATVSGVRVDAMFTGTNVAAGRVSTPVWANGLFGKTLTGGATYVADADGATFGSTYQAPSQSGFSVDLGLPIFDQFLNAYAEYASLSGFGNGQTIGVGGSMTPAIDYKFEYRILGQNFVPGYFNATYESNPSNISLMTKSTSGWLGYAGAKFLDDYVKADLVFEQYDGLKPSLTGALGWRQIYNCVGVINYVQTFPSATEQGLGTFSGDFLYITGGPANYVVSVKRVYTTLSTYDESYSVGVRINLGKLFSLPF